MILTNGSSLILLLQRISYFLLILLLFFLFLVQLYRSKMRMYHCVSLRRTFCPHEGKLWLDVPEFTRPRDLHRRGPFWLGNFSSSYSHDYTAFIEFPMRPCLTNTWNPHLFTISLLAKLGQSCRKHPIEEDFPCAE